MENREPLLRSDWTIYRGGAVMFEGCEDCGLDGCFFDQVGGNAVFVNKYNRRVAITTCKIVDAGASGVCFVGDPKAVRSPLFEYSEKQPLEQIDRTPTDRDRRLIHDLMVGERTADVARKYGMTPGRVSQKRCQFMQDWQRFCATPAVTVLVYAFALPRHHGRYPRSVSIGAAPLRIVAPRCQDGLASQTGRRPHRPGRGGRKRFSAPRPKRRPAPRLKPPRTESLTPVTCHRGTSSWRTNA
jgi:hypothetical protein